MEKKKTSKNKKKKMELEMEMEMEFGVRIATHSILKELNNGCNRHNLVFSPLSLHICLNLLAAGAKCQTLNQLLRFLDAKDVAQLNAQSSLFMELADEISGRGNRPIVSLLNGIWLDQRFTLKHSFKRLADNVYKAQPQSLDFKKAEKVVDKINAWARSASKGHIDNIVTSDSLRGSSLVLANALYFKGSWLEKFDASNTRVEDFRLLNRKRVRVPFMKQRDTKYFYRAMEGFQLLKMGYKKGGGKKTYSMYIFLPNRLDGLPELVQKFHSDPRFFTQNHKLESVKLGKLWLPKFKFGYESDISKNMKELGLDLPFQEKAELTDIVEKDRVYVSKAIQKSYIEVNEEGTVAASITKYTNPTCARPSKINFVADHPFLFMIKEEISGVVLFVGATLNPLS